MGISHPQKNPKHVKTSLRNTVIKTLTAGLESNTGGYVY